ncbi:MAG: hypothetical protein GY859_13700 [Desulfobacterales bacterium]|nr:hypothetical protein [Desulfobacterales bacterium]
MDLDRLFDKLSLEVRKDPFLLFENLTPHLNRLKSGELFGLIEKMAGTRNRVVREAAAFMLLHPDPDIRSQTGIFFASRIDPALIDPVTLRRMIGFRNWLPDGERPVLDRVIRRTRRARVTCAPMPGPRSVECYATPFDGSGCQVFYLIRKRKRRYQAAAAVLRHGEGIRDFWAPKNLKKRDLDRYVGEMPNVGKAEQVRKGYINRFTSHVLHAARTRGNPPPAGFLEVAENSGEADYWRPRSLDIEEAFSALEKACSVQSLPPGAVDDILKESESWCYEQTFAKSWFEDDVTVDDLLREIGISTSPTQYEMADAATKVLLRILDRRRDVWCERLYWMAMWARACKKGSPVPWNRFFIIAREIHRGAPLEKIPLMVAISLFTIASGLQRMKTWS